MTSVQKSNQDRISVGNGNVIACEHIKNLPHLICTCKPTSVLRVFMVWWFFCLSLHAHSDSEGDGKTLSWLRQQVSYTSLYPCSRWPDDEGEYKLYQLLSVHACSGDGRKSYQTLKSKNIIIKSHLYLNVKRTHRKTYKQVLTNATTLPYHYVPVILISSDWSLLVWSGGDDRNWHCAGIYAVCDPVAGCPRVYSDEEQGGVM